MIMNLYGAPTTLYVGDDRTDEDVFAILRPSDVPIRVGRSGKSQARYYLQGQKQVNELLRRLTCK
jgi:trehalose 6-phosphate phosphatase